MHIPVMVENVEILLMNFNIPISNINDDFIEVLKHDHISISYIFDGINSFLPVIECKMFNTKKFILGILDKETQFNEIDEYYFTYFSNLYSIKKINKHNIDDLNTLIIKMYFNIIKCIKYELNL